MSITITNKQDLSDACNPMGINLPDFAIPQFINRTFLNKQQLNNQLLHVNTALKQKRNQQMIQSMKALMNETLTTVRLPLYTSSVSCGFTSPAEDHVDNELSLDTHLVANPTSTFFVRATGDSMINAGIHNGDLLIVDRSLDAQHNAIVLAIIDTEFTVKRLLKTADGIRLKAENPKYKDIVVEPDQELMIWGVVVHVIHDLRK